VRAMRKVPGQKPTQVPALEQPPTILGGLVSGIAGLLSPKDGPPPSGAPPVPPPAPPAVNWWEFDDYQEHLQNYGQWRKYDDATQGLIAAAVAQGKTTLQVSAGSSTYALDFGACTQTKLSTGFKRQIRKQQQGGSPTSPPKAALPPSAQRSASTCVWEWEDDPQGTGKWRKYDDAAQAAINAAASAGKRSIQLGNYTISLTSMTQTKSATGFSRSIRKGSTIAVPPPASSLEAASVWSWEDDPQGTGKWRKYDDAAQAAINAAASAGKRSIQLGSYMVDLTALTQTKIATGFSRKIRRE